MAERFTNADLRRWVGGVTESAGRQGRNSANAGLGRWVGGCVAGIAAQSPGPTETRSRHWASCSRRAEQSVLGRGSEQAAAPERGPDAGLAGDGRHRLVHADDIDRRMTERQGEPMPWPGARDAAVPVRSLMARRLARGREPTDEEGGPHNPGVAFPAAPPCPCARGLALPARERLGNENEGHIPIARPVANGALCAVGARSLRRRR